MVLFNYNLNCRSTIHVRESWRDNQELTIQRDRQNWAHKTKDEIKPPKNQTKNTHRKLKHEHSEPYLKTGGEPICSRMVSSSLLLYIKHLPCMYVVVQCKLLTTKEDKMDNINIFWLKTDTRGHIKRTVSRWML